MNNDLLDFMTDLRVSKTTDQAGQSFISFAQKTGANVVHTFFGTAPEMQSVSTLPASYTQEEGRVALRQKNHLAEAIRGGTPRIFWGLDFEQFVGNPTKVGTANVFGRFENFQQRSSVTYAMPNADNSYSGAGIGIGFEDTGAQFLKRMDEAGGAFAVASFAAYSQMLTLRDVANDPSPLTPRQAEILTLLASGHKLGDIADSLKISDSAVNLYLSNMRTKLKVRTKEQALAMAISKGWIEP